ncbi:MAG: ABC transporter permease [Lachnospiraceae bacterium]|nr:ABC transporter permease [Lachnospiraceae bacterium]
MRIKRYIKKALQRPAAFVLCILAVLLILIPVMAPWIAPNDPIENDYTNILIFGSRKYPMGTDQIGRCILSRLIYGGRTSLLIVFVVIFFSLLIGVGVGVTAGLCGGITDMLLSRLIDLAMAVPATVFTIALVSVLGSGLGHTALALIIIGWGEYARISRSLVLSLKNSFYIEEAKLGGARGFTLVRYYILPNIVPYLLVVVTQDVGAKLLTMAGLSLLGLSSQPPTPEWGFMLSEGRRYIQTAPWLIFYPGLIIMLHVMIFGLLGDCLRDIFDPREQVTKRRK